MFGSSNITIFLKRRGVQKREDNAAFAKVFRDMPEEPEDLEPYSQEFLNELDRKLLEIEKRIGKEIKM